MEVGEGESGVVAEEMVSAAEEGAGEELEERCVWRRCGAGGWWLPCEQSERPDRWGGRRQGPLLGKASWEPARSRCGGGRGLDWMPRRQLLGEHAPIMLVALRRQRGNLHQRTWWETWKAGRLAGAALEFNGLLAKLSMPRSCGRSRRASRAGQSQGEVRRGAAAVFSRVPSRNLRGGFSWKGAGPGGGGERIARGKARHP